MKTESIVTLAAVGIGSYFLFNYISQQQRMQFELQQQQLQYQQTPQGGIFGLIGGLLGNIFGGGGGGLFGGGTTGRIRTGGGSMDSGGYGIRGGNFSYRY